MGTNVLEKTAASNIISGTRNSGRNFLRKVGNHQQNYSMSQQRRPLNPDHRQTLKYQNYFGATHPTISNGLGEVTGD